MAKKILNAIAGILVISSSLAALPALAKVKVVTSLPDLAWAVKEIGKDHVEAKSLLNGTENPHYADAVPEFIRLVADADVMCVIGLELEIGWLPKVLSRSGNAKVQQGGKGYCELGRTIEVLEKPSGAVDRSMGDVHPFGNPHFWLSPKALSKASEKIAQALIEADPAHAKEFTQGLKELQTTLEQVLQRNQAKLKPVFSRLSGPALIEYHKEFSYFLDAYDLKSFGSIEEKPGVPPSAGRLAEVAGAAKVAGVKLVLAATYTPKKTLHRFSELSGLPVIAVPTSMQPSGKYKDYITLQNHIIDEIVRVLK